MVLPKLPTVRAKRDVGTALSEINVTPFVDVMLVLLVIFMITAPMMQSGIGVDLPTAETDTVPAEEGLPVTLKSDQTIYIADAIININLLERRLQTAFYGKSKRVVFLRADKNLPFGFVMDVLDIIKKTGIEVVGLMTQPEEKAGRPKMIAGAWTNDKAFKRALTVSGAAHVILFAFIIINPALPKKSTPKGVIHYLSMGNIGGGGGNGRPAGGNRGSASVKTEKPAPAAKKESLRDLTTPEKAKPKAESNLRYPVDAKTKRKPVPEKKASISPSSPGTKTSESGTVAGTAGQTGVGGSGLMISPGGEGTGTGEGGIGAGFGEGLANFPYSYYLIRIQDEIQVNWFPKRIDPGPNNVLQTVVYFRIYRNGTISTVDIKQSSGIQGFDMIAVRAVINAAPFPPLPDDFEDEYLGINLLFEHKR